MKLEIIKYLPEGQPKKTALLFVHGAFHGAWCWEENFLPYFSQRGYPSYAVSLRGHGKSEGYENIESFTLGDYVEDISGVLSEFEEPPVLIGHSAGGAVVQKVLELYPDQVKAAVLMASFPYNGAGWKEFLRILIKHFKEARQLKDFNNTKLDDPTKEVHLPVNIMFGDKMPEEKKKIYSGLLQAESPRLMEDVIKPIIKGPEKIQMPVLIVGSTTDWFFSKEVFMRNGRAYKTKPVIFQGMGHDMMLVPGWEKVAEEIIDFLSIKVSNEMVLTDS